MTAVDGHIYRELLSAKCKKICVLIDPDKNSQQSVKELVISSNDAEVDFVMVGGSLLLNEMDTCINTIKKYSRLPVILFPGQLLQLSLKADAILFLSLISGRNPDLLIGRQVEAAPLIKKSGIEAISTGYMIVESGQMTSVEYMSNTKPLPANKPDIAIATAQAAELLGMKLLYIDAGSGAQNPISADMIKAVKSNVNIPLIVGGGLRTEAQIRNVCDAGADIVVVGNVLENDTSMLSNFVELVHGY